MGVHGRDYIGSHTLKPIESVLVWIFVYIALWIAVSTLAALFQIPRQYRLFSLLGWGGCYFAATLFFARTATNRIKATVATDIVPYASAAYMGAVSDDLAESYSRRLLVFVPLFFGILALGLAFWAIVRDIWRDQPVPLSPQLVFWGLTYFIYMFTAAQAVFTARFYLSFARCLEQESDSFYVLNAAESPLVKGLAKLGGQVLAFWGTIFVVILSIMVLSLAPAAYRFGVTSWLLAILIPGAGFFSFGYGAIVYLESEARIRAVLRRFTQKQAAILQARANAILDPAHRRVPQQDAELNRLVGWHDRILAGGNYGSRVRTSLSILLPFIPLVSLIQTFYGWLTG